MPNSKTSQNRAQSRHTTTLVHHLPSPEDNPISLMKSPDKQRVKCDPPPHCSTGIDICQSLSYASVAADNKMMHRLGKATEQVDVFTPVNYHPERKPRRALFVADSFTSVHIGQVIHVAKKFLSFDNEELSNRYMIVVKVMDEGL